MNKMKIGIDIDGTVANLYDALLPYVKKWKKDAKLGDLKTYDMSGWNLNKESLISILKGFETTNEYLFLKPYKDSVRVINKLYKKNEVYFLTARDQYERVSWDSLLWLTANQFKFNGLFSGLESKHNKIKDLKIDLFIDDNPDEIDAEANCFGTQCIVYHQRWNENLKENELIKRCKGWKNIEKYFVQKNLL